MYIHIHSYIHTKKIPLNIGFFYKNINFISMLSVMVVSVIILELIFRGLLIFFETYYCQGQFTAYTLFFTMMHIYLYGMQATNSLMIFYNKYTR